MAVLPAGFGRVLAAASLAFPMAAAAQPAPVVTLDAPPALSVQAERLRRVDHAALARLLAGAGLPMPSRIDVTLIGDDDPRGRSSPSWIVGLARGPSEIIIFPSRIDTYPFGSLESTYRHEVVHLALGRAARGQPLPRWFHEGVAVSVEGGWGFNDQARLLVAMAGRRPMRIADVEPLFEAGDQQETTLAYRLSAALVDGMRARAGPAAPGEIAARVGRGEPFVEAFAAVTGELPDDAAARAWTAYRRWTRWVPAITSTTAVWFTILALAVLAFAARRRRSRRLRQRWADEEDGDPA